MEHRGVQIVNASRILFGSEPKFVGRPVNGTPFDAAARQPHAETVMVMIASQFRVAIATEFHRWGATKFAAPQHQRFVEQPALLQVGQ